MRGNIFDSEKKMKWKEMLLSIFFPRRCPLCDEVILYEEKICKKCAKKVPYIKEPVCKRCGKQLENERQEYCADCGRKTHHFTQGKAVFLYQKEMKLSMYRFKYAGKREYVDFYVQEAIKRYENWIKKIGIEVIVPVPVHRRRKRERGYNQAEVFAKALGKEINIPVNSEVISRIKNTAPQKELTLVQRKDNLKGAFQVGANIVKYNKILLVDDIYTTGATIDTIAELLKRTGAEEVYFLSICIGEGC